MADPLSITAGIIAVLQLTTTAVQYLNDVKDAPAERQRILIEVVTVSGFLHTLKVLAESMQPDDLQVSALRSLNVPDGPLEQVKCALERLVSKIKPARGLKRVSTSLTWTLNKADVNNILASIERQKALFLLAMQNDHIGLTKAMTTGIAEIQHGVQELNMAQIDRKMAEALQWLSSTDPSSNHHTACEKHEPTTGDWLLKSNEFETWKNGSNSFLWLHGKAGSGKTILCSTVIEATKIHTATLSGAALAYFYFDFNDAEKQHVKGLICSLIAQISHSRPGAAEKVRDMYKSCQDGQQRPSMESLQKCLKEILYRGSDTYLVIDALDECTQREELLNLIEEICSWKLPKLKILTTSRSERDIEDVLSTLSTCVCIESAKIDSDIRLYVDKRLNSDPKLKKWSNNADLAEEIRIALVNGADGMFRWVICQMDALRKCLKVHAVRKALKALPKDLDATYTRILNSIDEDYRDEAFSVLQWLAFSARPMRLEEIAEATSMAGQDHPVFKPEERLSDPIDVLTICTSLVTLTKRKGAHREPETVVELRLAHFSVKEYLLSQRIPANLRIEEDFANLCIAKTCLAYLLYFDFNLLSEEGASEEDASEEDASEDVVDYPLLRYAAEFWPEHVRAISDGYSDPLLNRMTLELLNLDKLWFLNWLRQHSPDDFSVPGPPLYLASLLGLSNVTRTLINNGADVNAQGGYCGNALQAAAYSGEEAVIKLLLDAEADVNAQGGFYGNALQAAALSENEAVIQLLLDAEADVNAQGGYYGNSLQAAVLLGDEAVIQLLLDAGADVNAQGGSYGNALQLAVYSEEETVIKLLLDAGADVNAQGESYDNALQEAAWSGNKAVIQLLLDAGADVNTQGGHYGSALYAAALWGNETVIKLLLDAGADVNAQVENYSTALQAAVSSKKERTVELLLDAGADVNTQGGRYGSALYAAALWGNETVIKLLLDAGADVNAQVENYSTALQAAVSSKKERTVELLLDAGADVNAQGGEHGSALGHAINKGHQPVIDLLLAHGAKTTAELESEREASFHSQSEDKRLGSQDDEHSNEDPTHGANATPPPAESPEKNSILAI